MSRSNNVELINPAVRFYEWSGGDGKMKYFDKSRGEKGENVLVDLPFHFLVLDILHTIRGFSDADQSGFWANEVREIKKEQLTVRTKKGVVATDLYSNLSHVLNQGAAYSQSVYIATKDETGKFILCNFQIKGSAIGEWINACKGRNIYKYGVSIIDATPEKKGKTNYFTPVYKLTGSVSEESELTAKTLDKELQEYLTAYFKRTNSLQSAATPAGAASEDIDLINTELQGGANEITEPIDDLPF